MQRGVRFWAEDTVFDWCVLAEWYKRKW